MTAPTAAAPITGAAAPDRALAWGVVYRADVAADGRITGHIGRPTRHGSVPATERWCAIRDVHTLRAEPYPGLDQASWLLAWLDGDGWHTTDNIPDLYGSSV